MFTMKSCRSLKSVKGRFKGKKDALIIANGPSVNGIDFDKIDGEKYFTVGLNAAAILCETSGLKLDYLCVSDVRFVTHEDKRKILEGVNTDVTTLILRKEIEDHFRKADNIYYVPSLGRDGFSYNFSSGFFFGSSTTIMAIQLAYFLGAKNIYLVGVDLRYKKDQPRFYPESKPQIEDASISIQLYNLDYAKNSLNAKGCNLYLCSEHSFARPYVPFCNISNLFVKDIGHFEKPRSQHRQPCDSIEQPLTPDSSVP